MGASKLAGILGSVIIIVGLLLLPAIKLPGTDESASMWAAVSTSGGWGHIALLVMGALGLLLAFMGKTRVLIVTGILSLGILGLLYMRWSEELSGTGMSLTSLLAMGFYSLALGGLLQLIAGFMKPAPSASAPAPSM